MSRRAPGEVKGLTTKWTRRLNGAPGDPYLFKEDFAFDEQGRLWRRQHRSEPSGASWPRNFTRVTPWHVADPYVWYPQAEMSPPEQTRINNVRARLPKFERFLDEDGRPIVLKETDRGQAG